MERHTFEELNIDDVTVLQDEVYRSTLKSVALHLRTRDICHGVKNRNTSISRLVRNNLPLITDRGRGSIRNQVTVLTIVIMDVASSSLGAARTTSHASVGRAFDEGPVQLRRV